MLMLCCLSLFQFFWTTPHRCYEMVFTHFSFYISCVKWLLHLPKSLCVGWQRDAPVSFLCVHCCFVKSLLRYQDSNLNCQCQKLKCWPLHHISVVTNIVKPKTPTKFFVLLIAWFVGVFGLKQGVGPTTLQSAFHLYSCVLGTIINDLALFSHIVSGFLERFLHNIAFPTCLFCLTQLVCGHFYKQL